MKKWLCTLVLALLLAGMACCAMAAAKTYELGEMRNGYFVCEDFEEEMTQKAAEIFSEPLRDGDKVLCGTLFEEHFRNQPDRMDRGGALMAVRRDGRILLMSANTNGAGWKEGIETDSFLPPDAEFSITTMDGGKTYAHLTILYRDTAYEIRTTSTGGAYVYEYSWMDETGKALRVNCYHGEFTLHEDGDWPYTILAEGKAVPSRLCAWTADALPKTEADIRAFETAYPLKMSDDEAYITGVNLRERATGESPSWGVYNARVKLLGEKPGKQAPWVHVRVGNIDGWVSGDYVHSRGKGDQMHVYSTAATVHPVGRARTETALMRMPGGEAVMQLKPDTYVHVLGERDGWLHVILPRGEMTWQTDWDGTYGFVRAKDVAVGVSMTDAKYVP